MAKRITKKLLVYALVIGGLIPIIITAVEIFFSESQSVIFLGNYNPKIAILVGAYYILLLVIGVFWFTKQLIVISKLKTEKVYAELMLLKSQVSPHFFFNMLNNLYGLVAKDAKLAQELILKLSNMMRYSIYEGEKETVTLKEEVDYLKNYIELHKMRYHKSIDVNFNCEVDETVSVVPLLFIMLLENSFKHGVETLKENAYIKINLISFKGGIQFAVENNFDISRGEQNKSGNGLSNLKRRLELIYPSKHKITYSINENVYKAILILNND